MIEANVHTASRIAECRFRRQVQVELKDRIHGSGSLLVLRIDRDRATTPGAERRARQPVARGRHLAKYVGRKHPANVVRDAHLDLLGLASHQADIVLANDDAGGDVVEVDAHRRSAHGSPCAPDRA